MIAPLLRLALPLSLIAGGCASVVVEETPSAPEHNQVIYVEIVTSDVDATCTTLEQIHGVTFGAPVPELGNARTVALPTGENIGVRAPMHGGEEPATRPYLLVDDIQAAVRAAVDGGAQIAVPPMPIPGHGTISVYFMGGVQYGLWQL